MPLISQATETRIMKEVLATKESRAIVGYDHETRAGNVVMVAMIDGKPKIAKWAMLMPVAEADLPLLAESFLKGFFEDGGAAILAKAHRIH